MKHFPSYGMPFALDALAAGGVIACPTEAVWGLSCDPWNESAVARVLALKCRPQYKGLILVAGEEAHFDWLTGDLPESQQRKLKLSWPGPATWLVPHNGRVPASISGMHATVAIRVTAHPQMAALCRAWGGPLVSTSANRAGGLAPVELFQVRRHFGRQLDYVMPGRVGRSARPSVIRDVVTDAVIRA